MRWVIKGVIPADEVGAVRASVVDSMQIEPAAAMAKAAGVRAEGHRIGRRGRSGGAGVVACFFRLRKTPKTHHQLAQSPQ